MMPSSGQFGTLVTINGTNLLCGADAIFSVTLAGAVATIVSENITTIVLMAPAGSATDGNVTIVALSGGTATALGWTQLEQGIAVVYLSIYSYKSRQVFRTVFASVFIYLVGGHGFVATKLLLIVIASCVRKHYVCVAVVRSSRNPRYDYWHKPAAGRRNRDGDGARHRKRRRLVCQQH